MSSRILAIFFALLAVVVVAQGPYYSDDAEAIAPYQMDEQTFFVPILSNKRSLDQKIKSLKERTSNGQFKGILFGRKK